MTVTVVGIVFWSSLALFVICYITEAIIYGSNDYSEKATKVMLCCLIGTIITGVIILGFLLMALIKVIDKI